MLEAIRLGFAHPGRPPLFEDLEISIEPGERIAVAGPNGSGKSTLLCCLSGITPCGTGRVSIDGFDPSAPRERPQALARTGFLFDSPEAQFLAPTVEREIAFGLENQGVDPRRLRMQVGETLERFGLAPAAKRNPSTLSGGEGQRLALASVFVTAPSYLFLDEPTSRLDATGRRELEIWLASLRPRPAIVEATLRREQAARADRVVGILDGRLVGLSLDGQDPLVRSLVTDSGPAAERSIEAPGPVRLEARDLFHHPPGTAEPLFRGLSLEVRAGEVLVVRGPTASGKTTLLRILAGFEKPDGGRIRRPKDARAFDGGPRVAYLPQFPERLLFAPTVLEDVAFGPRRLGMDPETARRSARSALERVGLESPALERVFPADLSHGERRRVAIAGLIATRPAVVLLDEPEVGLDRSGRDRIAGIIAGLRRDGAAILVSTHEAGWLARLPGGTVDLGRV